MSGITAQVEGSPSPPPIMRSGRLPELDGLRGVAILSVVLMHFFYDPAPGIPTLMSYFQHLFALGWSGVDLFFVLSGFLIGGILMDNSRSHSYFKTFYARRFFRIIPVYYTWILLFIVVVGVFGPILRPKLHSGELPPLNFDIFQHFLFLQNLWDVKYITLSYWWFSPTWSLAVEEQFYLVSPLVVRHLARRWLPVLLGLVIILAPLLRLWVRWKAGGDVAWPAYRLMPCRADSLAIGVLAAYFWRLPAFREYVASQRSKIYAALSVLFALMLVIWWRYPNPNDPITQTAGYTVIALFYCTLLVACIGVPSGGLARIMRLGILREFGRISYCLYLIHAAVGYFCFGLLTRRVIYFRDFKSGCIGLLSIALAYSIACLSWKYLEEPMLRFGHTFKY